MVDVIKPEGVEFSLTTANTVYGADGVRLVNNQATTTLITVNVIASNAYPGQVNVASTFTMLANSTILVKKTPQDTIAAAQAVLATPVAWLN